MDTPTHDRVPPSTSAPADSWFWRLVEQHPVVFVIGCVLLAALAIFLLPDGPLPNPI
jgi:hypothetical protein